jgi:hypothetical protein
MEIAVVAGLLAKRDMKINSSHWRKGKEFASLCISGSAIEVSMPTCFSINIENTGSRAEL